MIKAIETRYGGYRFRSRLEARWAVFFDTLGVRWEYEREGFELPGAGRYLPDFWLPTWGAWFEVKPTKPASLSPEWNKARALADHDHPVIVASGNVASESLTLFCSDIGDSSAGSSEWSADWSHDQILSLFIDTRRDITDMHWEPLPWVDTPPQRCVFSPRLQSAYIAARSARFEHGERG